MSETQCEGRHPEAEHNSHLYAGLSEKRACRLEEVGKQAERRIDRAEGRGADLQRDLHQAQHRAHQVLPQPVNKQQHAQLCSL